MKKKILFAVLVCIVACCFAICISASTVYLDISGKEMFRYDTDSNGVVTTTSGEFPKVDKSNKELTWYITGTKTENGNTVHTVASAYSLDENFATLENGVYTYVGTTKDKIVSANFPDNAGILTLNIGEGFGAYSKTFPYANAKILFCYFPNTLTELPWRMFQLTPVIKAEFDDDSVITTIPQIFAHKAKNLKTVNIPASVNTICAKSWWEGAAFYGCISLESVTISGGVTSIGNEAFSECTALTEINFNATAMDDLGTGNNVFYNVGRNGNGITVTIGKNVTKIPARLFCPVSDEREYYPKVIKVIFEENSQCTSIGQSAFNRCRELENINIPSTVTSVGAWAFQDNYSLTSITIPKNVTSIGKNAFSECQALTEINFNATAMADLVTGNTVFYNAGKNGNGITVNIGKNVTIIPARLFCPDSYSTTYSPKITKVIFEKDSQYTTIAQSAFNQCINLQSINIPSTVKSIGPWAFQNNYALTNIIISKSITSIEHDTFLNCSALTVYAEASSKPSGWDSAWNSSNCPVVWDYKNTIRGEVFTFKGYSFAKNGSMAFGYDIDYESKALYEELTGDTLEIGVVFAGYDLLGGNQPLDDSGKAIDLAFGMVVKAELNEYTYTCYDFVLRDIADTLADTKLVISAYMNNGSETKYVQENGLSDTVTGVTYNEVKESIVQ